MLRTSQKSNPPTKRGRAVLIAILAASFALVITCAIVLLRSSQQVHRSILHMQGVREARMHVDALQRLMVETENLQRGYLLSGEDSQLTDKTEAANNIHAQIDALEGSLRFDALAHARFAELRDASSDALGHLQTILQLSTRSAIFAASSGAEQMTHFRDLAGNLGAYLASEEATLQATLLRSAQFRSTLILVLIAANVVLVAGLIALSWQFARMRTVVQIVSRSPTIEHEGEWITYEAYLDRRFGVKTSRGVTFAEVERLGWVRTPPGAPSCARSPAVGRRRTGRS